MAGKSPPRELAEFPVGHIVAERYEVLDHIGHGGMGFVVKAKDLTLDNEIVALKILYPRFVKDKVTFARFRREVLLTRRIAHPNVVKIYDLGDAGKETFFISMEYVEGESLAAKLAKSKPNGLPMSDVAEWLYQISLGLDCAHSYGVIHRDIKPANIIVTSKGEVKIADFGVARAMDSKEQLTRTNEALGSPFYMSPEQLNASAVDQRTDLYALGIMAFELLTGQVPFDSEHYLGLVTKHMTEPIPEFASKAKGIPFWAQEFVNRAAAKDPAERFQSGIESACFIARHHSVKFGSGRLTTETKPTSIAAYITPLAILLVLALVGTGGYLFIW